MILEPHVLSLCLYYVDLLRRGSTHANSIATALGLAYRFRKAHLPFFMLSSPHPCSKASFLIVLKVYVMSILVFEVTVFSRGSTRVSPLASTLVFLTPFYAGSITSALFQACKFSQVK